MERIALKLNDRYFELAKFETKFTYPEKCNDFIKVSLKTQYSVRGGVKKINDKEYTLHPLRTQLNTKTKEEVHLADGHNPPRYNPSYESIYPEIGYKNFTGSRLSVYECSFNTGFMSHASQSQPPDTDYLSLDIEYDEPFWFGILFMKKTETEIKEILESKTVNECKIFKSEFGSIVIAVRRLIPEWEKLGLPKDSSALGQYIHETFIMGNA